MNTTKGALQGLPVPKALKDLVDDFVDKLGSGTDIAEQFERSFLYSWGNSIVHSSHGDDEYFVATGDIPAMWLRDSTAQVFPYLLASTDREVYKVLSGVLRRQLRCLTIDPYANAFNDGPLGVHGDVNDRPEPGPWVWERKFELDSLCAPLQLAYALWKSSGRTDHLDPKLRSAVEIVIAIARREQHHERSEYKFVRPFGEFASDTLENDGRGKMPPYTGMVWSAFRPSDDKCHYNFLVPANALLVTVLCCTEEIAANVWCDAHLAASCRELAREVQVGILNSAVVSNGGSELLAYEVDGEEGVLMCDDANLPSLLSLPLTGWCSTSDPLYKETRDFILSKQNPYYFAGSYASGVGSPHTPQGFVWPLALAVEGLTGNHEDAKRTLEILTRTTGGTGMIHESFDVDNPAIYTRPWFGWANAMYAELAMKVAGVDIRALCAISPRLLKAS